MFPGRREHQLAAIRRIKANRGLVRLRPLPARTETLVGEVIEKAPSGSGLSNAERRRRARAGTLAVVDGRPAIAAKLHFIEEHFASGKNKRFGVIAVIEQEVTAAVVGHDAAMAGTLPMFVAGQDRVRCIFLPRTEQRTRTRDAHRIGAAAPTTARTGVKQIKPVAPPQ